MKIYVDIYSNLTLFGKMCNVMYRIDVRIGGHMDVGFYITFYSPFTLHSNDVSPMSQRWNEARLIDARLRAQFWCMIHTRATIIRANIIINPKLEPDDIRSGVVSGYKQARHVGHGARRVGLPLWILPHQPRPRRRPRQHLEVSSWYRPPHPPSSPELQMNYRQRFHNYNLLLKLPVTYDYCISVPNWGLPNPQLLTMG